VGEHDAVHEYRLRWAQAKDAPYVPRKHVASRANKNDRTFAVTLSSNFSTDGGPWAE
jgi:hypothetical protein